MKINWSKIALAGGAVALFVWLAKAAKPKSVEGLSGFDLKKRYNQLTENNDHTAAAKLLIDRFGNDEEKELINEIADRHEQRGNISKDDQRERDRIARKYFKRLKNL